MNLVLDKSFEIVGKERKVLYKTVVRGNSILMWELLEKVEWYSYNLSKVDAN